MIPPADRAYLVIPKLIPQPTWGGTYILGYKGWQNLAFANTAIGQSYELSSKSLLSLASSSQDPVFAPEFDSYPENSFPISQLIRDELKTLIKFTQAKGNSFQIHVKPGSPNSHWLPKPESWYFFEEGIATLGIKNLAHLTRYKEAALKLDAQIKTLSEKIKNKSMTLENAKLRIKELIAAINIYNYVNLVRVPAGSIVDLSQGGVHHSWEEDESLPKGNIVYEVQMDVMDHAATIRSFDKGKITSEGTTRPLQIEDYFRYLDTTPENNTPQTLLKTKKNLLQDKSLQVSEVFKTKYYTLHELEFKDIVKNQYTDTANKSFHHLFVKDGALEYQDAQVTLEVSSGHSIFIPTQVGKYSLQPLHKSSTVLKTYL